MPVVPPDGVLSRAILRVASRASNAALPSVEVAQALRPPTPAPVPLTTPVAAPVQIAATALRVRTVTRPWELRALEPRWQSLADEACEANPFLEPWALVPALEAFFPEDGFELLLIDRQDPRGKKGELQLCGLFAFERHRPLTGGPSFLRALRHPYLQLGTPLVRAGMEAEVFDALFSWLHEGGAARSLVRIDDLPADGPLRKALTDALWRRGLLPLVTATHTRALFRPASSAEDYLERAVGGRRRKEHRRLLSRLSELGPVEVTELPPGEDPRNFIAEFAELEARGWKGREAVAVQCHAAHERYFSELLRRAQLEGRLMATALRLSGTALAMKVNLLSRGGAVALKITYDESFAKYSPGVLLEVDNIQRLHARGGVPWMDSCAAPNRFMINQLWSDRREVQSVLLSSGHLLGTVAQSLFPLLRAGKALLRSRGKA